jgi:tetratricopeptide (TPR) repeat protein
LLAPAAAPLALLLLARPTLYERNVTLTPADGVALPVIELAALGTADGEQLLHVLLAPLPEVPATLATLLLERAAGNPFFLEALVGMLIDDGVIDASASPWQLRTERLAALRVPPTLVGVLQARLDVLPAHELATLQAASIVGPVFWEAALGAVIDDGPAALPALAQRALVAARSGSAFSDTAEHAFAHQLLHDTTYETVLKEQRRAGHARAAQWLAQRVSDRAAEFLAITAEHYERAGDSAKALEYWDRAYRDARARYALSASHEFATQALAQPALDDARWRYNLLNGRATVLDFMGKAQEAAAARAESAAWAELQDDDVMRAGVLQQEMLRADHEGRPEEARLLAERVLQLVAGQQYGAGDAALAHGELAWLALQRAQYDEVSRHIAAGVEHARRAASLPPRYGGFRRYEQQLRAIEISALIEQERYPAALAAIEQARNALGQKLSPHDRFNLLQRECMALRGIGRPEAGEAADELLRLALQSGVTRLVVAARHSRARTLFLRSQWQSLAEELVEFERAARETDGGFEIPGVRELQGHLAASRGDKDTARAHWREAVDGYLARGRERATRAARAALAMLDLQQGRQQDAREAVDALLEQAQQAPRGWHSLPSDVVVPCCEVLAALDDPRAGAFREHVRERLAEQLASLPDDAARALLLTNEPDWRRAARLTDLG